LSCDDPIIAGDLIEIDLNGNLQLLAINIAIYGTDRLKNEAAGVILKFSDLPKSL
jgi:hypothetical protein